VEIKPKVVERLVRYAAIDTQSKEGELRVPSTEKQFALARLLVEELRALGIIDVRLDQEHCYVYATVPATLPPAEAAAAPAIGFIAHLDTSPSVSGTGVRPVVHENYAGGDIALPGDPAQVIRENPFLRSQVGADIVTSDGTTLLGADDKAGIAAIMTAVEYWMAHPGERHGTIRVAFTPDEEVGKGTAFFDVRGFGADFAYTVDGGETGEISDETFHAQTAVVTFAGRNTHPGYAKGILVNSLYAAGHFLSLFPEGMKPETTEGREGYLHPHDLGGNEELVRLEVLLRDFEVEGMAAKGEILKEMAARVEGRFPGVTVGLEITDSYRNMKEVLGRHPRVVAMAEEAMRQAGVTPFRHAVRGGTDGARLSFMGLPTPNLFAGVQNPHSKLEWVSSRALVHAVETIVNLARLWSENGNDPQPGQGRTRTSRGSASR
jgi:tripeptide aminopeptidase